VSKRAPSLIGKKLSSHPALSAGARARKRSLVIVRSRGASTLMATRLLKDQEALDLLEEAGIVSAEGTLNPAYR
jgi:hypothetical protein